MFFFEQFIENYLYSLKSQKIISKKDEILIIDEKDWKMLEQNDPEVLLGQRHIILGFSSINELKQNF